MVAGLDIHTRQLSVAQGNTALNRVLLVLFAYDHEGHLSCSKCQSCDKYMENIKYSAHLLALIANIPASMKICWMSISVVRHSFAR